MKYRKLQLHDKLICNGVLWQIVEFDKKQLDMQCEEKVAKLRDFTWSWDRWFTKEEVQKMFKLYQTE